MHDANENDDPNDDATLGGAFSENYRREALEYAFRNLSEATNGSIVSATCGTYDPAVADVNSDDQECADIKAGHWAGAQFFAWDNTVADGCVPDPVTGGGCYVPATMKLDAVQVAARRADANTNPLPLFFAGALGMPETDVNTVAVATTGGGFVTNGCLVALNNETGEDETFHLNGTAEVTTVSCDIIVDQCCDGGGCQKGALRANGTPLVSVVATPCDEGDVDCVPEPGEIIVCGSVLSQGSVTLDPEPQCNAEVDEGSNYVACADDPDPNVFYDPLEALADNNQDWIGLAGSACDYTELEIHKMNDPTYEYYSPGDVTSVDEARLDSDGNPVLDAGGIPIIDTFTVYTLHPGTYCGTGSTNSKAIKVVGSQSRVVFSDDDDGQGIYVIKDGKLDFAGSMDRISGDPVGFFLTGDPATLDWTGSNTMDLRASADELSPLFGLIVVQDPYPPTTEDQEIKIAGSNEGSYYGGFYVPNADVNIVGAAGSSTNEASDCLYIIADELEFSGTSGLTANNSCSAFGGNGFTPSPLFFTLVN